MEKLLESVKKFIINARWEYDFEITQSTLLQDDLKIYGDDASEILAKFCKEFDVKYDDFKFNDYFRSEDSWTDFFEDKKIYKKFTVGHLVKSISNKVLEGE